MNQITLHRTGLPPIKFMGEEIASGSTRGNNSTRWTTIRLYRSKGGKWLYSIERRTCWQGEKDHVEAGSVATPQELIEVLKNEEGLLGEASQEACEEAAQKCPEFAAVFVEIVE